MKKTWSTMIPAAAAMLLLAGGFLPAAASADQTVAQNGSQAGAAPDNGRDAQRAGSKAGTEVDDTVITSKVKAALLKDPEIKSLKISVDTEAGNVTLGGKAKNDTQIARAVEIASATKGVKTVTNNISVGD